MLESDTVLEKAAALKSAGKPFTLVTVVRCEAPTSAKPGAKAIVEADGMIQGWIGGGCAQPAVIKMSLKSIYDGQSRLIRISPSRDEVVDTGIIDFGMTCHSGGTLDIFIDPVIQRPSLLIIGASPVARALCGLAQHAGFSVISASPGANKEMFPDAKHIIDGLEISGFPAEVPQFVIVATQGKHDEAGLEAALNTRSHNIALVASKRKTGKLRQYLKQRGHNSERIDAIRAPAGIDIGAVTPEEIAISIVAGLVQARRMDSAALAEATETNAASQTTGNCCSGGVTTQAETIDPVCGMSVDPETTEFRTEHCGKTYYFCCSGCERRFTAEAEKFLV